MKNENFVLQSSLEANYLSIELQDSMRLDEIAINVINEDCPEFLIPFRIVNIDERFMIRYRLINAISLKYYQATLQKAEFVRLYLSLLTPFVKGKDWFLDYHHLCVDSNYIYIDKITNTAYFIYVPEASYRNSEKEILSFFNDTFTHMTISDDADFQIRIYRFFAQKDVTLEELYGLFQRESGQYVSGVRGKLWQNDEKRVRQVEKPSVVPAPVVPNNQNAVSASETGKADLKGESLSDNQSDEVIQVLFGDKKKNHKDNHRDKKGKKKEKSGIGLFGRKKEMILENGLGEYAGKSNPAGNAGFQGMPGEMPMMQGVSGGFGMSGSIIAGGDMGEGTEISDAYQMETGGYLELIDSPIPGAVPRIDLNFLSPYITIGRMSSDEVQPDVAFSREFMRIGRKHARIEKRDGSYYVIDLGSANKTILNGQVLIPNQPYLLQEGGELVFTNSKPVRYRIHL